MKRNLLIGFLALLLSGFQAFAQERTVSGRVTSEEDGSGLPGVNVVVSGTTIGTITDVNGNYDVSIPEGNVTLVFSFVGLATKELEVGATSVLNVQMSADVTQLSEVVVTALGVEREKATLSYASQEINTDQLNITQDSNLKTALAGKVAGVQINGQAGSKLGQFGKIRIRGAISLTTDNDPLYVVDGVPTDPNSVDMDNVASVNVLKGPNATALYGQRADAGVVVITTKKGKNGMAVEFVSSVTWDKVSYLPNQQNLYGKGYEGEASFDTFDFASNAYPEAWQVFDGKRFITGANNYADESWGPKFDGGEYVPWYAFWPDSPYYGQTANYTAQEDNVKEFYETGRTVKNTISVSGGGEDYNARLSYTNLSQNGITPYTNLKKHFISTNFDFNVTDKFNISTNLRVTSSEIKGDFDDGYGNQTSGTFNSWFARDTEMSKLRELKDLQTIDGHSASWNWWGPEYYTNGGGFKKAAFWFNPFTFLEQYEQIRKENVLVGSVTATYQITEELEISAVASRDQSNYNFNFRFPFYLSNSAAPELYNAWINSFGTYERHRSENNFSAMLKYKKKFGDIDVAAFFGGNLRRDKYRNFSAQMNPGAKSGGLIIPDVYSFSNAGEIPTPTTYVSEKHVNSVFGNVSLGYKDYLYLDMSARKDWSSALPSTNNGYFYPSIGASFIFSELLDGLDALSFGKIRGGWAQVGNDVNALALSPLYATSNKPFGGEQVLMYNPTSVVAEGIKPAINSSIEAGLDARFINNRVGLAFTYYKENRKDEIIPVTIPTASGYNSVLQNAGESQRSGVEITLDGDAVRAGSFTWNVVFNYARNRTKVISLPGDLDAIGAPGGSDDWNFVTMTHQLGNNWGQLKGIGYARDEAGNKIIQPSGLYKTEADVYFGSVLPDFTGGFINNFRFKNVTLTAAIDFQKGGHFFSLSEMWGRYSGLLVETAETNENGKNVRDAVAEGGGVRVIGVDEGGAPVDQFVEGYDYFHQFQANTLAEEFVHDASYVKLRDISLTYDFTSMIKKGFVKGASLSLVARNIWLIAVSKENKHGWDPSELSQTYGESGQVPGTRSYGFNIRLNF